MGFNQMIETKKEERKDALMVANKVFRFVIVGALVINIVLLITLICLKIG